MVIGRLAVKPRALALLIVLAASVSAAGWYLKNPRSSPSGLPVPDPSATQPPPSPEPAKEVVYELPEAEREYLWDIEHHGNLLVKYGFKPLAEAVKNADAAALSRLLDPGFKGSDMSQPRSVRAEKQFAVVERLEDAGQPPVPLDRDAFVARLVSFRKLFSDQAPPSVKMALMTLSPKVRKELDGPWEGQAQLRIYGEQTKGGPAEVVLTLRYELARPTQELLKAPAWLRSAGFVQSLTARSPHRLFAEVAAQRGLDGSKLADHWKGGEYHGATGGAYVCDFDRDGVLDVLITDFSGVTLYKGRTDGTFEDATVRYGLPTTPRGFAAWIDVDGDGWEDLILFDRVFRNDQGKRFLDYTAGCNLRLPQDANGLLVADYDRDGRLDLYVVRSAPPFGQSWLEGRTSDPKGNYLFRNLGGWRFADLTAVTGTMGGHRSTFAAAWLDANNDGWPDLHVINEFGDGVLLVNNRDGTFREHALADKPADFGSMGLAVGDVDGDGNIDIYCANMYSKAGTRVMGNLAPDSYPPAVLEKMKRFVAGSELHLNRGGLRFEQVGRARQVNAVGWAYGPCLADLDNDGWLDLYTTAGFVSRDRNEPDG